MSLREHLLKSEVGVYLTEADMLDISIASADKFLTTKAKIDEFLTSKVSIEEKLDGVKLTVIKVQEDGNLGDYIIAYKENILYAEEFDYQPMTKIKKESISNSQFKLVLDHFSSLPKNTIPIGTELFIEFLMSKPTLSSNYKSKHKMVLIGYSKSKYDINFGKLRTYNTGMLIDNRAKYAKELKIDVPSLLFKGVLGASTLFESGILSDKLKSEFNLRKNTMHWNNQELLVQDIKSLFLFLESKYGGTAEGIVASYNDKIIKFQQSFQTDQLQRMKIKSAYTDNDAEIETNYWKNVQGASFGIVNTIKVTSKIEDMLKELALIMKKIPVTFTHSKKTEAQIKDDIQGNAKTLILKKMKGNNNCLYFGKFRVLTKAHYDIIKKGQRLFDDIVVGLITSKDTADTKDLRKEMLLAAFPNLIIIENNTGNISNLLNKTPKNINAILAGSDRVRDYQNQIGSQLGLHIKEIPRTSDDISATKVIQNIEDESYFQKNTPKEIWRLYDKIKKEYKGVVNGV